MCHERVRRRLILHFTKHVWTFSSYHQPDQANTAANGRTHSNGFEERNEGDVSNPTVKIWNLGSGSDGVERELAVGGGGRGRGGGA